MRIHGDWDNERYMDWADRERIIRQEVREINEMFRREAQNYRECERKGVQHERADIKCKTESGSY